MQANILRVALTGRPAGHLSGVATYKERYDVTRIIGNILLVNLVFHSQNNFSENYQQFRHATAKL
jgi:hypothetical protein